MLLYGGIMLKEVDKCPRCHKKKNQKQGYDIEYEKSKEYKDILKEIRNIDDSFDGYHCNFCNKTTLFLQ